MRQVAVSLAVGALLLGCGSLRGEQVPLVITDGEVFGDGCVLLYEVVDVIADPTSGTVVKGGGWPLRWPKGYTGRRVGSEVQVLDPAGNVVLTTGGRYRIGPANDGTYSTPISEWVVGCIDPCPDCELGSGIANADRLGTGDPL
jgi:hypothetical protein